MRRLVVVAIAMLFISISISGCLSSSITGFTESDLNPPVIANVDDQPPTLPTPLVGGTPTYRYTLDWTMTEVFVFYGGAMNLSIRNTGDGDLFVYGYGLRWTNSSLVYSRDAEAYVHPDEKIGLGLLAFSGPPEAVPTLYSIILKVAVRIGSDAGWHDYGDVISADRVADVRELVPPHSYSLEKNVKDYYNKVNAQVNFTATEDVVRVIRSLQPGPYSTLQIACAFDWVQSNIEYVADVGGDYWQSAEETLQKRTGDCEDQAILMASIIGALGGNARVNIINEHAFSTVFICSDVWGLNLVWSSLISYYGTTHRICFLNDSLGYWLVVDTTGFPYAGGLPATSSPSSSTDTTAWTFDDSNWLVTVDATGKVATGGGLF